MTRFRYPNAGDLNPKTTLHVISFCVKGEGGGGEAGGGGEVFDLVFRSLSSESKLGRWIGLWDYKVQCGWIERGEGKEEGEWEGGEGGLDVWVDLLDRRQQTRSVVSFPVSCFVEGGEEEEEVEGGEEEDWEEEEEDEEAVDGREMSFVGCPLFLSCEDIEGVSGLIFFFFFFFPFLFLFPSSDPIIFKLGVRVWREEKTSVWINKQVCQWNTNRAPSCRKLTFPLPPSLSFFFPSFHRKPFTFLKEGTKLFFPVKWVPLAVFSPKKKTLKKDLASPTFILLPLRHLLSLPTLPPSLLSLLPLVNGKSIPFWGLMRKKNWFISLDIATLPSNVTFTLRRMLVIPKGGRKRKGKGKSGG